MDEVQGESPISRDEVLVVMGALSDILVTTQQVRDYLMGEDDEEEEEDW
jgi:hypothetical protein